MKLVRHESPVSPFDAIFDRLIPTLFTETNGNGDAPTARLPRTNVQENDSAYVLTLEMPGLAKENVEVNFEGDTLVVKGEKSEKTEEKGVVRREYRSARFERSFHVKGIDREQVKAKMEDGILVVTLPKTPERVGKKIDVA